MNKELNSVWRWVPTFMFFIAAILLATKTEYSKFGFPIFFTGHLIFLISSWKINDRPLILSNAGFMVIDAVSIYRWFI